MDRKAAAHLDATLAELGEGIRYRDRFGPAMYQVAPGPPRTVVVCMDHDPPYVGLIPSIPRVPRLRWTCGVCQRRIELWPPLEVVELAWTGVN